MFEFELRMIRHDDRGTRAVNGERGKTPCLQQYDKRREGRRCRERTAKGHGFVDIEQNDVQSSRERERGSGREEPAHPAGGDEERREEAMGQVERKPPRIYLFLKSACQPPAGQPPNRSYGMHPFVDEDARIPSRRVGGVSVVSLLTGFTWDLMFPASTTTTTLSGVLESARTRKSGPSR